MPIYEYRCENGHTFEVLQSMTDDPPAGCRECGAPVQRVLRAPAVHFKGSGFYTTDYARKGKAATGSNSGGSSDAKGDSGSDSKKSDSGSESKSGSGKSESKAKD